MTKQRVILNVYYTRADCVDVVIDEDDFAAWTAEIGDPHTLSTTGAAFVLRYMEDRNITGEVGEGELVFDDAVDLELLGEEEE